MTHTPSNYPAHLLAQGEFLHRMGRETNQGKIPEDKEMGSNVKRIIHTSKRTPIITSTHRHPTTIDTNTFAQAIGAQKIEGSTNTAGNPVVLLGLRQKLYTLLRSTGGRKRLEGTGKRYKIPLIEGDWERLQEVAKSTSNNTAKPSPAQIASLLVHEMLNQLEEAGAFGTAPKADTP